LPASPPSATVGENVATISTRCSVALKRAIHNGQTDTAASAAINVNCTSGTHATTTAA